MTIAGGAADSFVGLFKLFIKKNLIEEQNNLATSVGSLLGINNCKHMANLA